MQPVAVEKEVIARVRNRCEEVPAGEQQEGIETAEAGRQARGTLRGNGEEEPDAERRRRQRLHISPDVSTISAPRGDRRESERTEFIQ